jgi:hypothetical protein
MHRRKRAMARRRRKNRFDDSPVGESRTLHNITIYRRGKVRQSVARERKPMPENFSLSENYDAVAACLAELRHSLNTSGQKLERFRMEGGSRRRDRQRRLIVESYIDFANMRRITPVTALVLASEYDRAISLFEAPDWLRAINIEKWHPEVFATLRDVGFLSLLGVESKPADIVIRDGKYTVPFLSGVKVRGALIDQLIRAMAELADTSGVKDSETLLSRSRVYDGLGEAVQNVEDHAYPFGAFINEPVVKKWWMTGSVEPSNKKFTVAIYDQGISIPVSLPRWTRFAEFRSAFAKACGLEFDVRAPERDGDAIAQAVELGRSSTGKSWHGKGLPLIREIVENCAGGTLRIVSRCGEYVYKRGGQPEHKSHPNLPLSGTLVEWDLLL